MPPVSFPALLPLAPHLCSPSCPRVPFLSFSPCLSPLCASRRYLIIENFIPPEEKNKIVNRLYFDCEEDQWKFQPLVPAGGCVRLPASWGEERG